MRTTALRRGRPSSTVLVGLAVALFAAAACDATDDADETGDAVETTDADETADAEETTDAGEAADAAEADPSATDLAIDEDCFGVEVAVPDPDGVTCGTVTVPLDHDTPDGDTIDIAVAAVAGESDAAPVYVLNGGPGAPLVAPVLGQPEAVDRFAVDDRDLVLIDQRGVGRSDPELSCAAFDDVDEGAVPDTDESLEVLAACRDELTDAGVDLAAFDHTGNAEDIHAVRAALGHDEVVLRGASYGSHLALHAATLDPAGVEALVLNSPADPSENYLQEFAPGFQGALERVAEACAADERCAEPFGDLEEAMEAVVARLADQPEEVTAAPPIGGDEVTRTYTPETFLAAVFATMYLPDGGAAILPLLVHEAREGDLEPIASMHATQEQLLLADLSHGMYHSMVCTGEAAAFDADAGREAVGWSAVQDHWFAHQTIGGAHNDATCEVWDVPAAFDPGELTLADDVPALLVTGGFDHVTPPETGERLHAELQTSYLVEAPTLAHDPLGGLDVMVEGCGASIVEAFVADPTTEPDTSCVERIPSRDALGDWFG